MKKTSYEEDEEDGGYEEDEYEQDEDEVKKEGKKVSRGGVLLSLVIILAITALCSFLASNAVTTPLILEQEASAGIYTLGDKEILEIQGERFTCEFTSESSFFINNEEATKYGMGKYSFWEIQKNGENSEKYTTAGKVEVKVRAEKLLKITISKGIKNLEEVRLATTVMGGIMGLLIGGLAAYSITR